MVLPLCLLLEKLPWAGVIDAHGGHTSKSSCPAPTAAALHR